MKILKNFGGLLLCIILFSGAKCETDDNIFSTRDELPPLTQTGAQTFGCLINGELFVPPKFGRNSPRAFYQYVRGAYTLGISAGKGGGVELISINFGAIDISGLQEGRYTLLEKESGNYFGTYFQSAEAEDGWFKRFSTSRDNPGELNITNFDPENFIISGTFSFTLLDEEGEEIKITEGRFDLNYTN